MSDTTDRELLEKAAKAAGYEVEAYTWHAGTEFEHLGFRYDSASETASEYEWNPLADDGDALRLAVKLQLEVVPLEGGGVDVCRTTEADPFGVLLASESDSDRYAATRRAIVRAAASMAGEKS